MILKLDELLAEIRQKGWYWKYSPVAPVQGGGQYTLEMFREKGRDRRLVMAPNFEEFLKSVTAAVEALPEEKGRLVL